MAIIAKGPPYFTPTWEMAESVLYKPSIPEVEERKSIFPELYESVKEMTESERKPIIPLWDGRKPPYEPHDAGLKRTLRELVGDGDWDHLRVYADGRSEEGKSEVEWVTDNQPVFDNQFLPPEGEERKAKRERKTLRELVEKLEAEDRKNKLFKDLVEEMKLKRNPPQETQIGGTHYSDLSIQPWDAMRAWMSPAEYIGYHVGTIIGYLSRHKAKGGEQDLHKAGHHMDELRRYLKEDEEYPF